MVLYAGKVVTLFGVNFLQNKVSSLLIDYINMC